MVGGETAAPKRTMPRWRKLVLAGLLGLIALLGVGIAVLNSGIGHRLIVDRIAAFAPASGLRIGVGRIDGSLYGAATLHDVTFADPQGVFLRVPLIDLDWRPFNWFSKGLDVRTLAAHRGVLTRLPDLRPGNPDAPVFPNFDIRVDRFVIDRLTVAEGVVGPARKVDLAAKVDIRAGRALVKADGSLGGGDKLAALIDAAPDRDKFDVSLDYAAPRGGLLAGLIGAQSDVRAIVAGKGTWTKWDGGLLLNQAGQQAAAFRLTNRGGRYALLGSAKGSLLPAGLAQRALGKTFYLGASGTFLKSVIVGRVGIEGAGVKANGGGRIDLARNLFDRFVVKARLIEPELFGAGLRLEGLTASGTLDGPFRNLAIAHRVEAARLVAGTTVAERLTTQGTARYTPAGLTFPLDLAVAQLKTGNPALDPRLVNGRARGTLTLAGGKLASDALALSFPGLDARLALRGDIIRGGYALAGPVAARGFEIANLGAVDAGAQILFKIGADYPWTLRANLQGRMPRVTNATLASLAGTGIRFAGSVSLGARAPLLFDRATFNASKLNLALSGRRLVNGQTSIAGSGRHADYGPFTVQAAFAGDGPRAVLVFANPLPAAGLRDVRVALSPIKDGFRIETAGGSTLGPFTGTLGLFSSPGGPTRVVIDQLSVWKTAVTGTLLLNKGAATGNLALAGGGLDGTIRLAPRSGGQGFDVALDANNAQFAGPTPLSVASGHLEASGLLKAGHTTVTGNLAAQGISTGTLFIGRLAASAQLSDGRGKITASVAGRRGAQFALQLFGDVAPERIAVLANGTFAGKRITMPRRAVLTVASGGGWNLAPTQIGFGGGTAIASGRFGGRSEPAFHLALADMPLSLADIAMADLGLGGKASGLVDYARGAGGVPTGRAQLQIKGLTRSGLVLTSRPVDVALVAVLGAANFETRAVIREGAEIRGRFQGRIGGLPQGGTLIARLRAGGLFAQLRYNGPADALWRLLALETFDLTGPLSVAADATGSLANPSVRGSLASDNMRLQSALTGTDLSKIAVRGTFAGSRLALTSFSGRATNGGTVSGSGSVDLSGIGVRGPGIDLKLAARGALLLARDDMAAAVTGPLRIVSDGVNGTIAGRLTIDTARWQLGRAAAAAALPNIRTREINRAADIALPRATSAPWRYLIDAAGDNRIDVRGLGIDSEWGANLRIRGTTAAPTILGRVDLVRGGYEFAGKRFEMTRGRISFVGENPPNPRLDIAAEADISGLNALVTVTGTALSPEIAFSSTPALPEEELLARLLFGNSITQISAPEALQLGAALASLRGGGGLDPINKLRAAIGLDRLRIVGADAALGRATGVAVGKYLGRRFYVEIITDGRGYSATELEFRVSSWLSILASISTVGRESLNARVSKDY